MKNTHVKYPISKALNLNDFKEMDYFAVKNYFLPIELMMENAGLHLAKLITRYTNPTHIVQIGIGNGNNGGGGLVAARRLSGWGYTVHLDLATEITKELPQKQLERALSFGAQTTTPDHVDVWVDAYLGFSQRLPLPQTLTERIQKANQTNALRISLDIPTGFASNVDTTYFHCDKILTLAAPKKILYHLPEATEIYIADIGIPNEVYQKFDTHPLPFHTNNILKLIR